MSIVNKEVVGPMSEGRNHESELEDIIRKRQSGIASRLPLHLKSGFVRHESSGITEDQKIIAEKIYEIIKKKNYL